MEITINGENRTIEKVETLDELVTLLGYSPDVKGIAVALNDTVVPKVQWGATRVKPGDSVEVIHAVQGG